MMAVVAHQPKEGKPMFSKKSLFLAGASILASFLAALILTSFPGVSGAKPEKPQPCYTISSLQGSYAIIGNYGAHVAIYLGREYLDGMGNLTGTSLINEPTPGSTTGARTLATGTEKGTYTVNCDGTGVITRDLTVTGGGTTTGVMANFVITRAIVKRGQFIATAVEDAQQVPSVVVPGGIFLTRTWTRLPDHDQDADSD
jgi:hypothetical protein